MNSPTEIDSLPFSRLTPDKILTAVERIGVKCTGRYLALNSMENRVFEVEIELDEPALSRYDAFRVVKFYRAGRWSHEQILEEHALLARLVEAELSVAAPLAFPDGETLAFLSDPGLTFAVFPKIGGRLMDEFKREELEQLGRTIARLHQAGSTLSATAKPVLGPETFGLGTLEYLRSCPLLPERFAKPYGDLVQSLCATSGPWFAAASNQRLHGDCHVGNLLWQSGSCTVVDLDDTLVGPPVQDLWFLVPGRDEESKRNMDILLAAYEQFRTFDDESLRLVEPLRGLRLIHFSGWIARRWEDESFRRVFVEFGSDKYWSEQLGALHEIVEYMHGGRSF